MTTTSNIRKAALLVRSLDSDSAALLLAQLSPQEARAVRQAVRELGEIDPDEQAELASELKREAQRPPHDDPAGVELAISSEAELPAPSPLPVSSGTSSVAEPAGPFAWLEHGDLPTLAGVLEREHLSTVAVVLSHLPPERGADLLAALPPGRRSAALERLADLGESDRASLEVIEKSLAEWISRQKRQRQLRADRLQAIRALLDHTSTETRSAVLSEMTRSDKRLATELKLPQVSPSLPQPAYREFATRRAGQVSQLQQPVSSPRHNPPRPTDEPPKAAAIAPVAVPPPAPLPSFDFWQLAQLDRHDLGLVFSRCHPQSLVLALAGGSDAIMQHVTRCLPGEVSRELERRVNHLSQVRLTDVAKAQQQLALVASELMASGQLHFSSKA